MAEYVEKAAFREHLDSVHPFTKYEQRDPKYDFAKTVFLSELAAYPAADVQSVRHGYWVYKSVRGEDMPCCSECGVSTGSLYEYAYCPNCGALMDKEDTNG